MNHKATSIWHILCHIPLALCKSLSLSSPFRSLPQVPVGWALQFLASSLAATRGAGAGKLQLIPKLRMKSNCSLAHSVVLRTVPPFPPSSSPSCTVPIRVPLPPCCCPFCFYILLTADYSSCSALGRGCPLCLSHAPLTIPRSPQCMIFILCLSFIFLMSLIP